MSRVVEATGGPPSPEVVAQRIRAFREAMYERAAEAVVVYHPPQHPCPWPGCDARIAGIRFELEKMGEADLVERLRKAFWLGPGVVGRCPGCDRYVRFDVESKQAIAEPLPADAAVLPDGWQRIAYVVMQPQSGT
jgi:hypothetical protein